MLLLRLLKAGTTDRTGGGDTDDKISEIHCIKSSELVGGSVHVLSRWIHHLVFFVGLFVCLVVCCWCLVLLRLKFCEQIGIKEEILYVLVCQSE